MFAHSALVFAFGIGDFIARAATIDKVDRLLRRRWQRYRRRRKYQAAKSHYWQRVQDNAFHLYARAASAGGARISHLSSLRFDFVNASTAFHFHDLVAQQSGALEFEVRGSLLHFLFKLAQQLSYVEIAAGFADYRRGDFASTQDRVQTLLHRAADRLRRDAVFLVVIHLLCAPVFGNRHQRFHALRDSVGEEHHFPVYMTRRTSGGLDE